MCLVLYMSSDRMRPTIAWDEATPSFHVLSEDPDSLRTRKQFSKSHIYYLGSDNGCGCGFSREYDDCIDDPNELKSKDSNRRLLHKYLSECLTDEQSLELYSCWSGDEDANLEFQRTIPVDEILSENFFFSEKQLTIVVDVVENLAPSKVIL